MVHHRNSMVMGIMLIQSYFSQILKKSFWSLVLMILLVKSGLLRMVNCWKQSHFSHQVIIVMYWFATSLIFLDCTSGIAVRFNTSESSKFLVMEKSGIARIFSTKNFLPVTSLSNNYACQDPALDADWSSCNPTHVVTTLGGRIQHWNLSSLRFFFLMDTP